MGDDAFFDAMRDWVRRHRFGFTTASRLIGHLQARADVDLAPVFGAYLADARRWPPPPTPAHRLD
jgi:aminopeptidase N